MSARDRGRYHRDFSSKNNARNFADTTLDCMRAVSVEIPVFLKAIIEKDETFSRTATCHLEATRRLGPCPPRSLSFKPQYPKKTY